MFKFIILATFIISACNNPETVINKVETLDSLPKILVAGLPDMSIINAQNTVSKKYGFSFLHVGGCMISKELNDSMRLNNELTYKKLEARFGKGFRSRLFNEIEACRIFQDSVQLILNHNSEANIINKM